MTNSQQQFLFTREPLASQSLIQLENCKALALAKYSQGKKILIGHSLSLEDTAKNILESRGGKIIFSFSHQFPEYIPGEQPGATSLTVAEFPHLNYSHIEAIDFHTWAEASYNQGLVGGLFSTNARIMPLDFLHRTSHAVQNQKSVFNHILRYKEGNHIQVPYEINGDWRVNHWFASIPYDHQSVHKVEAALLDSLGEKGENAEIKNMQSYEYKKNDKLNHFTTVLLGLSHAHVFSDRTNNSTLVELCTCGEEMKGTRFLDNFCRDLGYKNYTCSFLQRNTNNNVLILNNEYKEVR